MEALHSVVQATVLAFVEIFSYMLNDRSIGSIDLEPFENNKQSPTFADVFAVLQRTVNEVRRGIDG